MQSSVAAAYNMGAAAVHARALSSTMRLGHGCSKRDNPTGLGVRSLWKKSNGSYLPPAPTANLHT